MKYVFTLLVLGFSFTVLAQSKNSAFEKGSKLLDKKDFKGAKEAFSIALEQDSTLNEAYYNRALAEFNLKEMDTALLDFQIYNLLNPKDEETMNFISFIHYFNNDYANLKTSVQEFIKISNTEYNSYYYLGYACYFLKQYTEAVEYFNKHLLIEPKDNDALYYRAQTYVALEKLDEAERDFTKLIQLKDDYLYAHYYRAMVRKDRENFLAALEDVNKGVKQNPDSPEVLELRGEIYEVLGDSLAAKADYDRAIDLKGPNLYEVLYKRGLLNYMQLANEDAAIADLTAVINEAPKPNYTAYFVRGILYTEANKLEEANADFLAYTKRDSSFIEIYYYWAELKFKMEKYDEALSFISKYLSQPETLSETNLGYAYQLIGRTHLQRKEYSSALQNFEKSLGYDEEIGETHFWLAKTLIALKRNEEACKALNRALDLGYEDAELELQGVCGSSVPN